MLKDFLKKFAPRFLLNWYYRALPFFGALFYRFPSRKLTVIGVTGTSGKSTVVQLATNILKEAGYKVASVSSICFQIQDKERQNMLKMTMPGRWQVQRFLRQAVDSGCQYAILEVTSEGIKQYRHKFIDFDVAVFTNLTPEHIESHGSFEKYRQTKGKLFQATKNIHIINIDDKNADYYLRFPAKKKYLYQFKNQNAKIKMTNQNSKILEEIDSLEIKLKLPGEFNYYNALAAVSVGLSQGIDLDICKKAVEKVEGIPGRMEEVISQPFKVIVDYALTPAALEMVYQTIRALFSPAKLICVLGACGGGRDKWKRPVLGKLAAQYCDEIIVTDEDPYDENPSQILFDIKSGISKSQFLMSNFYEILDRREAIRKSLELAKAGDTVIITGKGCEPWMCLAGGKKIPWDDRQIVRDEFQKIIKSQKAVNKREENFEILPHTADLKLKIFGPTKEKIFENAMRAMFKATGVKGEGTAQTKRIYLKAIDIENLLVAFLSEVLYLSEVNQEVYWEANIRELSQKSITADLKGQKLKERESIIKGVTFYDLSLKQQEDGSWIAIILFDI